MQRLLNTLLLIWRLDHTVVHGIIGFGSFTVTLDLVEIEAMVIPLSPEELGLTDTRGRVH